MSTKEEVGVATQKSVEQEIEDKILHILTIYPVISPTMLQGGIGPYLKPVVWRPILERLKAAGKVIEESESLETPGGRYNTYTKLRRPGVVISHASTVED